MVPMGLANAVPGFSIWDSRYGVALETPLTPTFLPTLLKKDFAFDLGNVSVGGTEGGFIVRTNAVGSGDTCDASGLTIALSFISTDLGASLMGRA